jgi:pimeloyl-ACP methyl ester carboxylesterase
VRLAYALTGEGPPLVRAAHWLTHLEFDFQSPVSGPWIEKMSASHRFLRYDERGCGLSDWAVSNVSLDAWVADLETVVDAVGWERFPLMGLSQGGPVAIEYAVRHPDRVSHLVLYGTYAQGWNRRSLDPSAVAENEALITLTREGWGRESPAYRQLFAGLFFPGADAARLAAFNDLQRITTSPENAARFLRAFGELDVTDLLGRVEVPTLVLHSTGDARCPFEEGRRLAAAIPGSRFVPLDTANHILVEGEPAWDTFFREVNSFLGRKAVRTPTLAPRRTKPTHRPERRRLLRWGVTYAAGAWAVAQVIDVMQEPWNIDLVALRAVQALLLVGLILTVVSAAVLDARTPDPP